jgi:hypothetical protein
MDIVVSVTFFAEDLLHFGAVTSDFLPSDLVSAYLNETKRELIGSTAETDPLDAAPRR